jgi:uncharacterized protein
VASGHDRDDEGKELDQDGPSPFAVFVLLEGALAPFSLVVGWLLGLNPLATFTWSEKAVLDGVLATLPMLVLLAVTLRWPLGPLARIKAFFDTELAPMLRDCGWADLALVSLAAGVGEEMLFRGIIQGGLARLFGPIAGVIGAAMLFGLLHPVSIAYIVLAGGLGIYLGICWMVSGNLMTVIIAHALYDFIALLVLLGEARQSAENSD